jgi:hypothetical protein
MITAEGVTTRYRGTTAVDDVSAEQWTQIAVTGATWLVAPLAIGLLLVMRAEVQ